MTSHGFESHGFDMSLIWPETTYDDVTDPYVDRMTDEAAYIVDTKAVAATGHVEGYSWSLVVFEKRDDPEEGSGRFAEFFLDRSSDLGERQRGERVSGSVTPAVVPPGRKMKTLARTWAATPPIVGYVCFTIENVVMLEIAPLAAEHRRIVVRDAPPGFPRFVVFFPPYGADGEIIALDQDGTELARRDMFHGPLQIETGYRGGD